MNLDPGIACYEHCDQGRLFAFSLPPTCDLCGADLTTKPLAIPPFRLPYPFVRASQAPCCVVIKPTRGDFLHNYGTGVKDDLHIGITDSEGKVFEYDFEGLHSDQGSSWEQCLAVPLLSSSISARPDPVWKEYWDFTITTLLPDDWTEERYDERSYNCYTFVIEFLKALRPPNIQTKNLSKTSFTAAFIVPYTAAAGRYISVYRRLLKHGVVAVPRSVKSILKTGSSKKLPQKSILKTVNEESKEEESAITTTVC